jgi:hypothetical protein
MVCVAPRVCDVSSVVYIANVSMSNSRADDRIRVAISPLEIC